MSPEQWERVVAVDLVGAFHCMQAFLARNPQGKHGAHRYRLEDFGLDPDALARDFAPYRDRFAIPEEG